MAVKASVTVTISCYRDTDTITRYYKLQASTAQTPAKPSTLIPSGWDDTEPTYTSGSTNTLYFVDRYIFSDGTFQYTEVSKSTSYEAAKQAYNKAQAAQDSANTTQENLDNLKIGNTNYIKNSGNFEHLLYWEKNGLNGADKNIIELVTEDGLKCIHGKGSILQYNIKEHGNIINLKYDTTYCYHAYIKTTVDFDISHNQPLHFWMKSTISLDTNIGDSDTTKCKGYIYNNVDWYVNTPGNRHITANKWSHIVYIFKTPKHEGDYDFLRFRTYIYGQTVCSSDWYLNWIKLEEGNKPTDWSPNTEDLNSFSGGSNLLRNTNNPVIVGNAEWKYGHYGLPSGGDGIAETIDINDSPVKNITKGFRITDNTTGNKDFIQRFINYPNRKYFTFSVWCKGSGTLLFRAVNANNQTKNVLVAEINCVNWTKVIAPFYYEYGGALTNFQFGIQGACEEMLFIAPKLEEGNSASDWTLAPEDLNKDVEIGGRNYFTSKHYNGIVRKGSPSSFNYDSNTKIYTITTQESPNAWGDGIANANVSNNRILLPYGKTLCVSFEIKVSDVCNVIVDINNFPISGDYWSANDNDNGIKRFPKVDDTAYSTRFNITKINEWVKCFFTYTNDHAGNVNKIDLYDNSSLGVNVGNITYQIKNIKYEYGNKPTDWSPAPEDIDDKISEINKSVSEVVVGTQTTTTASWTGVASFDTLEDKQQITYWLPQTSANNVTLNLTLAGGTTTGAKPVYYSGTTRLGTHYPAGNAIRLTYRKNVTIGSTTITDGWWADANYNTNDNTYDRIRFNKPIKVKSAINAGELIVSDSNGYFKLTAGCSFNLDIPILMCATSKSAGATDSTNNYLSTPDGNIRYNTNNSWNATQYKTLYLVGDIVGNIFIVDSTTPFTTTIPTTDNNKYYISLGYMHTTYQMYLYPEHPIFKYVNGQFKNISQIAYEAFTSEIGGRNLLIGSKKYNKSTPFKINNTVTNDSYLFNYFMKLTPIPNEYYVIQVKSDIPLASSHGYNTANIGKFTFWLYIRNTGTTKVWGNFDNAQMFCSSDNSDNKRYLGSKNNIYYWLYKMPSNTQDVGVRVNTYADSEHPITANFWDFKIEKGNKATDWTPPPEDEYFNDNILLKTKDMITKIGNDIINYRNSVTEDTSRLFAPNNEEICKIFKSGGAWADIGSDLKYYIQRKILNLNDIVTYSIYASTDDTSPRSLSFFCGRGSYFYYQGAPTSIRGNILRNNFGWVRYSYTFRITQTMIDDASAYPNQELACRIESNAACTEGTYVYWSAPKLEFGEYVTDWAESPEDLKNTVEEVSKYAQDTASKLLLLDNDQGTGKVNSAISRINALEGTITNLVKDDKGMVSMTQTGSGIKLDMTPITKNINELLDAIKGVATSGDLKGLSGELKRQLQELTDRTAYINASTDNQGRPVITLGATNSPFKVEITNEAINFIQNGQIIAYANGQKFYNLRTVVQQDVQIGVGPGFIWKTRESGNMGLTWVSGS